MEAKFQAKRLKAINILSKETFEMTPCAMYNPLKYIKILSAQHTITEFRLIFHNFYNLNDRGELRLFYLRKYGRCNNSPILLKISNFTRLLPRNDIPLHLQLFF